MRGRQRQEAQHSQPTSRLGLRPHLRRLPLGWTLIGLLIAGPAHAEGGTVTVLVLDTQTASPTDAAAAATLGDELTRLVSARPGLRVVSQSDLAAMVEHEADRQQFACTDDRCMAELSQLAAANRVVASSLGRVGGELIVNLSLLDPAQGRSLGSAMLQATSVAALMARLPQGVATLFGEGESEEIRYHLPHGAQLSFAVLDLRAAGLPEELAVNLTQLLAAELKSVEGATVISRDDIASMLRMEQDKLLLGCDDSSCMAEIGGALGVDMLVAGQVGKVAQSYVISLRMIQPAEAKVASRISETFSGQEEQLLPAIRHAGRRLVGISIETSGDLVVSASENGATVFVDDEQVGELPLPPMKGLPAGRHRLRISKDGYYDWRSDVYVQPDGATPLWAQIEVVPVAWHERWWVWGIAGALVVAAGATVYFVTREQPTDGTVRPGSISTGLTKSGALSW